MGRRTSSSCNEIPAQQERQSKFVAVPNTASVRFFADALFDVGLRRLGGENAWVVGLWLLQQLVQRVSVVFDLKGKSGGGTS